MTDSKEVRVRLTAADLDGCVNQQHMLFRYRPKGYSSLRRNNGQYLWPTDDPKVWELRFEPTPPRKRKKKKEKQDGSN